MELTVLVTHPLPAPVGVLLAAGAGTRYGMAKSLVRDSSGVPWLVSAIELLRDAGCADILVILGAAPGAAQLIPPDERISVVVADDWARGLGASLRAGLLAALALPGAPHAALITLVDLPGLSAAAAARVVAGHGADNRVLRQATYGGRPGHPVLIGREHWTVLAGSLMGDVGARDYLAAHGATPVECGDLGDGRDVDRPGDRSRGAHPEWA